jgi:hypothetical protein
MAIPKIKSTYSLDVETVRTLESLARRWNVSKTEVVRRAIRSAAGEKSQRVQEKREALRQLQAYVQQRGIDVDAWAREIRATRDESGRKRLSVFDDPS